MEKVLMTNAKIVDVLEKQLIEGSILIEDGIIKAVGDVSCDDAKVMDMGGKTVLPGLFNCHTHICMEPKADPNGPPMSDAQVTLIAIKHLREHLSCGVTFIRDVGGRNFIDVDLRDAIKAGMLTDVPDMQASGRCICMTGGHGHQSGREADGPDDCRKAAREMLKKGVDWVKLMATGGVMTRGVEPGSAQLEEEEMHAAVVEAHKVGVKTCTHAQGTTGIKNALRAGLDSIEHGCFLDDECIELMKKNGTWLVATLCPPYFILKHGVEAGIPEYAVRKAKFNIESHFASFRKAYAAGIKCACGTDAGTPFNLHSASAYELVLMCGEGLTPMQAIECATINSAELCSVDDILGSITPGKKAHFAVFEKNPLDDINNILDCCMTIKNGKVVYRKEA